MDGWLLLLLLLLLKVRGILTLVLLDDEHGDLVKTEQQNDYRRCTKCKMVKPASRYYKGRPQCKRCMLIYKQWKTYDRKRTREENEDVNKIKKDFFAKRWIEMGITG